MSWLLSVDARALSEASGGFRVFTENILACLPQLDASLRFELLTPRPLDGPWREAPFEQTLVPGGGNPLRRVLWERSLRRNISADSAGLFAPTGLAVPVDPVAVVAHDAAFAEHANAVPLRYRWYWRLVANQWRRARIVFAPSRSSAQAAVRQGVEQDRVLVTGEGVRSSLAAEGPPCEEVAELQFHSAALRDPFILFVGTLEPRKNVEGLIAAYDSLVRRRADQGPVHLVIAGRSGWGRSPGAVARRAAQGPGPSGGRVLALGEVSDEALSFLYREASMLCLPSWTEGFGLPALEAMELGTAVLVSDRGALPEVVGGAGVVLDPADREAWVEAIARVLEDSHWAAELVRLGRDRAREFSWQCAAAVVLDGLQQMRSAAQ